MLVVRRFIAALEIGHFLCPESTGKFDPERRFGALAGIFVIPAKAGIQLDWTSLSRGDGP
jgi:hypothetical protein